MENKQVLIKSGVNHIVGITNLELRVNKTWDKKGVVRPIDFDTLRDLIYEPGVEQLFRDGYLIIDDMEIKKALGLEPEDAEEPVNIIILTDIQKDNLLKNKPFPDFKMTADKMSYNQLLELAEYAIENDIMIGFDKNKYILERAGKNILKTIELKQSIKEE